MNQIQPLTKRQREILDFLGKFIREYGFAPSLEEIGAAFNLSALATVFKHLENLREKGYIRRRWNVARSIELVVADDCCPLCGRALEKDVHGAKVPIENGRKSDTMGDVVHVVARTTPTTTERP